MNTALIHTVCYAFLIGTIVSMSGANPSVDSSVDKAKDDVIIQLSEDYVKALEERPYVDLWDKHEKTSRLQPLPPLGKDKA